MRINQVHLRTLVVLVLFISGLAIPVKDVHANVNVAVHLNISQQDPVDSTEAEAFFDGILPGQLEQYRIPGVTVSVVKDGELIFAKGYGYADIEQRKPVVADRTMFHIGSITKLFTWTAVMQLVEQGRLDLHADVNTYLKDLQIPPTFPKPITLAHLLTHTPGFEDNFSTLFVFTPDALLPLRDYLIRDLPERVYPPGEIIASSNYGTALAGYMIEQVSGMPYEK